MRHALLYMTFSESNEITNKMKTDTSVLPFGRAKFFQLLNGNTVLKKPLPPPVIPAHKDARAVQLRAAEGTK